MTKSFKFTIVAILILTLSACSDSSQTHQTSDTSNELFPLFELINPDQSQVSFSNSIEENFDNFFARFNYVYNGGGVAIGDINNDDLPDLYFTGNEVPNKLYLNKGNFEFEDISNSANVSLAGGWHNGVTFVDINHDGWLDIYICRGGWEDQTQDRTNLLYVNNHDNTFSEEAASFGLNDPGYSVQASFFDMDNDGDLDMYLSNRPEKFFLNYKKVLAGKVAADPLYRDKLYKNQNGTFQEVGVSSGITNNFGYGLGLVTADINKDGYIDIYVANDYLENDYLYINQKDGTFNESIEAYTKHVPFYAMGVDMVDINNDGWEDIIELEMLPADYERSKTTMASMNPALFESLSSNGFHLQYMHNMLQLNRGFVDEKKEKVIFSEIAQLSGLNKTDWSWACLGSDFDNDGWRDIFITNGFRRDIWDRDANAAFRSYMNDPATRSLSAEQKAKHIIELFKPNKISNYIFRNKRDLTFQDKSQHWGVDQVSFSNGAALGDLDSDGDLDMVVNNIDMPAFIYKNRADQSPNSYLNITFKGPQKNPAGLGTKVDVVYQGKRQYEELKNTRGYLSSSEPMIHFGFGNVASIDTLKITWLDGKQNILTNVTTNQKLNIDYKNANTNFESQIHSSAKPWMTDVTETYLDDIFKHQENIYDEFKDQILLPHKLSNLGPALTVGDINDDGLDDFFVGGASGQSGRIYEQQKNGQFKVRPQSAFANDQAYEDVAALFFDADNDEDIDLYVVSGGNELQQPVYYQDRLYLNENGAFKKSANVPQLTSSGGCVNAADWDNDGDLDLFIGGRLSVANYPHPPKSYLLENRNGEFVNVTEQLSDEIENIGMVTDAVWTDLNGDEKVDLMLVGEWMPITIFENTTQGFVNATSKYELDRTRGWWNSISASDMDEDGDVDYVLGNLGENYKFQASKEKPFVVFADDFDRNGTNDIFLAKYYKDELVPIRGKECSSQQMPVIGQKYDSYNSFAKANIHEILDDKTKSSLKYEVDLFTSVSLEADKGRLIMKSLPKIGQLSAVNGALFLDANRDGKKDLILAGNKYGSEIETTRADASIGQVFVRDENDQKWRSIPPATSGLFLPGNVKGVKQLKIGNKQGFVVVSNDDYIKLFILNN